MTAVLLCLAGGLGAATRFVVDGEVKRHRPSTFPWATVLINVSGSFLLGLLVGLVRDNGAPESLRLVLGVGFCGGYTTFSTASFETVRLAQQGKYGRSVLNAVATVVLTVSAAALGFALVAT